MSKQESRKDKQIARFLSMYGILSRGGALNPKELVKDFGVSIEDLPGELGHQIGKVGMNAFKQSNFGKKIFSGIDNAKRKAFDFIYKNFEKGSSKYGQSNAGDAMRRAAEFFNKGGSRAATSAATSGASSGVASGLRETVSSVAGEAIGGSGLAGAAGAAAGGGEAVERGLDGRSLQYPLHQWHNG